VSFMSLRVGIRLKCQTLNGSKRSIRLRAVKFGEHGEISLGVVLKQPPDDQWTLHSCFWHRPATAGSSSAGALRGGDTLIAQIVRFARPDIQIFDGNVVDLYVWSLCAVYHWSDGAMAERETATLA
jgi:hypothetical protein